MAEDEPVGAGGLRAGIAVRHGNGGPRREPAFGEDAVLPDRADGLEGPA
jgi:hypothetical protein